MTDRTANCVLLGWWVGEGRSGSERAGGFEAGRRSEVSDEHSTSLTVVLHDGKHQSQVIYSLPLARTLPLFSLVMYVCKHQTKKTQKKQETGRIAALIASLFLYPPPPLCLSPSIQIRYADAWLVPSINLSVPLYRFSFTLFLCMLHLPAC